MKNTQYSLLFTIVFLLIISIFSAYKAHYYKSKYFQILNAPVKVEILRDTIYQKISLSRPEYINRYIIKYDTLKLTEETKTALNEDTAVIIPITQSIYKEDGVYEAYVSGYQASLDSINVYQKQVETIISNTRTVMKHPKLVIGPSISFGYNFISKKLEPSIGISVTLPINFKDKTD